MSSSSATSLVLDSSVSPIRTRPYSITSSGIAFTSRSASTSGKSTSVPTGLRSSAITAAGAIRSVLDNISCGMFSGASSVRPSVLAFASRLTDNYYRWQVHTKYRVAGCALLPPPPPPPFAVRRNNSFAREWNFYAIGRSSSLL